MADQKITDLVQIVTISSDDVLPIVDISDNITKKIDITQIKAQSPVQSVNASTGNVTVQATLVSGTNIKTINSTSILGSGNLVVAAAPSGVSGAVQFSDGTALSSDATNFFWDNANGRLGLGVNVPTARLHIKGSGTTSATTSLKIENSASINLLSILDNGATTIRNGSDTVTFLLDFSGNLTANNVIKSNSYFSTSANGVDHYYTGGNNNQTVGAIRQFQSEQNFIPTSGSATFTGFEFNPTINQTGGASGITRGLFINPVLTAAADYRAIQTSSGGAYINTTSVAASAVLQADSTTKGFLPPRMTTTQRNAIATPATGLSIYNTTTNSVNYYNGTAWEDTKLVVTNRQTASYTLAITDANKLVEINNVSANNLTVPLNSSVAYSIGTQILLAQYGAGQTTVVATVGVTIRSSGGKLKLNAQYSGATLIKIATDEWYCFGDLSA
jgi:hypothetical protein